MPLFHHTRTALSSPLMKRSAFCKSIGLLLGLIIALSLPEAVIEEVPMVRVAAVINALIIGGVVAIAGIITKHPLFNRRFHPLLRGGVIAAFIHLDFIIYIWPDKPAFWQAFLFAVVFGAILDLFATQLFGEGKALITEEIAQ